MHCVFGSHSFSKHVLQLLSCSFICNTPPCFQDPDVDSMRVSLQLMKSSAARLQVECKSAVLPGNTVDMAFLTQQVIQCAYDIAKAAKQLVTTFSVE